MAKKITTNSSNNRFFKFILVFFLLIAIYTGYEVFYPQAIPNKSYQLVVSKGDNLHKVARKLSKANVIDYPRLFILISRLTGKDTKVTAGMYILAKPMSMFDIIQRITNGKPDEIGITILEGWNFKQIRNVLYAESQIVHLTESMSDQQIRDRLKIDAPSMEGLIYPATYFIAPNQSDLEIIQNGYKMLQDKLGEVLNQRNAQAQVKSSYELLTLASLIQKETNDNDDMVLISTVFNNRLKIGMRLQDDPAVFYGLNNKPRITRADFAIDTPYNTYLHSGLPPTPICMPSLVALKAAAMPKLESNILYFVAIGKGKTKFSSTYDEHSEAVNKYLHK